MKAHIKLTQKQLRQRYHAECLKQARKSGFPVECFFILEYMSSLYINNGRVIGKNKPPKPIDLEKLSFAEQLFIEALDKTWIKPLTNETF